MKLLVHRQRHARRQRASTRLHPVYFPIALCIVLAASSGAASSETVSWRDVRPIVTQRCTPCHQPGGGAGFSLLSQDDIRPRVRLIQRVLEHQQMPPWLPRGKSPAFVGDRRLTTEERSLLLGWLAEGAAGLDDTPDPIEPGERPAWELGTPDLVFRTGTVSSDANERNTFRNLVVSPASDEVREPLWIRAVEIRPTRPDVAHHAVLTVDRTASSRTLDAESTRPGFPGMDPRSRAQSPGGQFIGWTPGKSAFPGYDDVAWRLNPGDDLVLLVHLLPREDPASTEIELGFYFADSPPTREVHMLRLGSTSIDLPPNSNEQPVTDSFTLPQSATLASIYPHAHYLAQSMTAWAITPNQQRIELLDIPEWDFHWQDQYRLVEPIRLPAGTSLHMEFAYDNPKAETTLYGPRSEDEMGDLWLELFAEDPALDRELAAATSLHQLQNLEAGYRASIERLTAPRSAGSSQAASLQTASPQINSARPVALTAATFNLADSLIKQGRSEEGREVLEQLLELDPEHVGGLINLGNLYYSENNLERALELFRRASRVAPEDGSVHFNLGNVYLSSTDPKQALEAFDRAVELEPDRSAYWLNRGLALAQLERTEERIESFLKSAQRDPRNVAAHANLAITFLEIDQLDNAELALDQALRLAPADQRLLELADRLAEKRAARSPGQPEH